MCVRMFAHCSHRTMPSLSPTGLQSQKGWGEFLKNDTGKHNANVKANANANNYHCGWQWCSLRTARVRAGTDLAGDMWADGGRKADSRE